MHRVFKSPSPTATQGIRDSPIPGGKSPPIRQILQKNIQNYFVVNTLKYFGYKVNKEYQLAFKIYLTLKISTSCSKLLKRLDLSIPWAKKLFCSKLLHPRSGIPRGSGPRLNTLIMHRLPFSVFSTAHP